MSYRVETTARAERDRQACYDYIDSNSPQGAVHWLDAYDRALESMEKSPFRGLAPESASHPVDIRQTFFATTSGLTYLYVIKGHVLYVLHVRGPGQDTISSAEMELPGNGD
ncbi:MAG: hypothetical protein RIC55_31125 [Pirellulaceae bacterium]